MSSRRFLVLVSALASMRCGGDGAPTGASAFEVCAGYAAWESSSYVLPYPVGASFRLDQGNCSGFGHSRFWKYGYDFAMPIGTLVTASRDGIVLHSVGRARDGDRSATNLVTIEHGDGTVMVYSHLTFEGALVPVGKSVAAGEPIARSGDTGLTGDFPHLHLSLHACGALPGLPGGDEISCPTIPLTFRNTEANPRGLLVDRVYAALPFD